MTPDEIKRARAKLKLTQQALAAKLGVTSTTVARWEAGTSRIHPLRLPAVAHALRLKKP